MARAGPGQEQREGNGEDNNVAKAEIEREKGRCARAYDVEGPTRGFRSDSWRRANSATPNNANNATNVPSSGSSFIPSDPR
jgi:hypothetical protein